LPRKYSDIAPAFAIEGGVHHRVVHLAADDLVLATVDLAPLNDASTEAWVEVPGERVDRFVVVVVGVEDRAGV
jgi:hypothetical protein